MKNRDLEPLDPLPATFIAAIQELLAGLGAFRIRVKPGSTAVLQVPAGAGNDQVSLVIEGKWRYATANAELTGTGSAREVDVYVVSADSSYSSTTVTIEGEDHTVEQDDTDYGWALAIVDHGSSAPVADLTRLVATAYWDGAAFKRVDLVNASGGVRGRVNADGTVAFGTGFAVSHLGTGSYGITFSPEFGCALQVTASCFGTSTRQARPNGGFTGGATAQILTTDSGSPTDLAFEFSAEPY